MTQALEMPKWPHSLVRIAGQRITDERMSFIEDRNQGSAWPLLMRDARGVNSVLLDLAKREAERRQFGFVYVFKGTHQGVTRYKIGKANRIADRRKVFAVKLPFDIELVASFCVQEPRALEAAIHREQKACRVGGEWFDLSPESLDFVCRHGMIAEMGDIAVLLIEVATQHDKPQQMNDAEYIEHLEALLALQGVSFSRNKAKAPHG